MLNVREKPPSRLHILITTPSGKSARWGWDEPKPQNVPSGLSFSTTIPGGEDTFDCTLPRKTQYEYSDLERLSHLRVYGAGAELVWGGRLERAPRQSGDQLGVNPQAVGYQAHLEDDNSAAEIYVDRDITRWGGASSQRKINLYTAGYEVVEDGSSDTDTTTGQPALQQTISATGGAFDFTAESWYDAGPGATIASVYYDFTSTNTTSSYVGSINLSSDDVATTTTSTGDLLTGINSSGTGTLTGTARRFIYASFSVPASASAAEGDHVFRQRQLTVWGNHGLTKQGTAPDDGLYASDVIANAVGRWAPLLRFTTGANGTIRPTSFIIPQLAFPDYTTASEIITQANRVHLNDWAIWDTPRGPTFYYAPKGEASPNPRKWRARVAPAQLEETGPQVDRIWNGVIVTYQDAAGVTRTVGPTGSLADTTSAFLLDTDPENPANQLGIHRYTILDMGITSKADAATEVGRRFMEESKVLDTSGSASLVGHVEDDKGITHAAWKVKAGDQISFVDASDPSYRRITKTDYDHDSRTNSIDLDAPPQGLADLLERLAIARATIPTPPDPFSGPAISTPMIVS